MYYTNTRLLYPPAMSDPEYRIPETAKLRGLAYDYTDHSLVTYDEVEKKLMWISRDDSSVRASVIMDPEVKQVLGLSHFNDFMYILDYEGDGHLAVYTGSFQQGREDGIIKLVRFEVPFSQSDTIGTGHIWDLTHEPVPRWLKYHPDFCNIINIGPTIYLLIGLADDVTPGKIPSELGQYIVEFDLLGLFRNQIKVDLTPRSSSRPRTIDMPNGLAKACAAHDGIMALLCREINQLQPNVIHVLKHRLGQPLQYETSWYVAGELHQGSAMIAAGKWLYTLIDNRIYKSEIMMIKLHMQDGWPNTQTLDLGNLSSGQVVFRKVRCQNIAPVTTYHDLTISSRDSLLLLSREDKVDENDYADTITIPGKIKPGDTFEFCICLTAPIINEETFAPYQYFDRLTFHPRKKTDYDPE